MLSTSVLLRRACLLGQFAGLEQRGSAIIILQKRPFAVEQLQEAIIDLKDESHSFTNTIYSEFFAVMHGNQAEVDITVIFPCNENHIRKYTSQPVYFFRESVAAYQAIHLPYIAQLSTKAIDWVYNILDGTSEADRVLLKDEDAVNGFTFMPGTFGTMRCSCN